MLSRAAAAAARTCLPCRTSLAPRGPPCRHAVTLRQPYRPPRGHPTNSYDPVLDGELDFDEDIDLGEHPELRTELEHHSEKIQALVRGKPRRDDVLVKQDIDARALGRPASVLILQNPDLIRRKPARSPDIEIEPEAPASSVTSQLRDELLSEKEPASEADLAALKHFDVIRPKNTRLLSEDGLETLMAELDCFFTLDQLKLYYKTKLRERRALAETPPPYPWILKYTPWKPAKLIKYKKPSSKRSVSAKIIAKIWQLSLKGPDRVSGRTLAWLEPSIFKLFFGPESQFSQTLTDEMSGKSSRCTISADRNERRIRIDGPRDSAMAVLARIDGVVDDSLARVIPADALGLDDVSDAAWRELERATETVVWYRRGLPELKISWLKDEAGSEPRGLQDPADVALRWLLARRLDPHPSKVRLVSGKSERTVFVPDHRADKALPWHDRMDQSSRRVGPAPVDQAEGDAAASLAAVLDDVPLPRPKYRTRRGQSTNRITATFGHILHPGPKPSSNSKMTRRVLSPVVPHPAAFTSVGVGSDKPVMTSTAVILNFVPDIDPSKNPVVGAPPLRLTLPVDDQSDLSNLALTTNPTFEAVPAPWHMTDVLLPNADVDVRLAQQWVLALAADQPALLDFLKQCKLDFLQGQQPETPNHASFSIPSRWLPRSHAPEPGSPARSSRRAKSQATAAAAEPCTDVPYLFGGLEIHQMVDLELDGCTLRYNSIEGGRQGNQRQEISLVGLTRDADAVPSSMKHAAKLMRAVHDVASGKLFSWHKGRAKMHQKGLADFYGLDWDNTSMPVASLATMRSKPAALGRRTILLPETGSSETQAG